MAKYVIIGNSTAAIGCVEGIRSKDKDGEIVLIASENHHTYAPAHFLFIAGQNG